MGSQSVRQVTINGTGLIGGSLGLALKQARPEVRIIGYDRDHGAAGRAQRRGAVDRAEWNLPAAVERADLVIVATPVGAVAEVFQQLAPLLKPGAIVTDTASTKAQVMTWAQTYLPPTVSFIGGHPMAGKEQAGVEAADARLFAGCTYCLMPAPTASEAAVETVIALVQAIGAHPYFLDPAEHDSFVAAISHLPFLVAAALFQTAGGSPVWRDLERLAASGFRDTTRLASGDPIMHRDICLTNRESILRWLDRFAVELQTVRALVAEGGPALETFFRQVKEARDAWLGQRAAAGMGLPSAGAELQRLFFGQRRPPDRPPQP